jgi:hypothetical protein
MDLIPRKIDSRPDGSTGYASQKYAESLGEFGVARELPRSGGWLLVSETPRPTLYDGMGCYPLFSCRDWSALGADLESLADDLVSVRLVTDPFADIDSSNLHDAFPDICREYKQHFVTDLKVPIESAASSHHRRNVRKALDVVAVRQETLNARLLENWCSLYENLVRRHDIGGVARFSPSAFALQWNVPGLVAFSARNGDETCGVTLWYIQGDVVYYHLAAYSDRGYELGASFALFWTALEYFTKQGLRWAALGAGAGVSAATSGLTRFKQGWATGTRPVYFCGRILRPVEYANLTGSASAGRKFFPAYRAA